jgi:hypothetical protein
MKERHQESEIEDMIKADDEDVSKFQDSSAISSINVDSFEPITSSSTTIREPKNSERLERTMLTAEIQA